MNANIYVLESNGSCLCVVSSLDNLREAVDYWKDNRCYKDSVLSYKKFKLDYHFEPLEWDWAYIPVSYDRQKLLVGGADYVPEEKDFGKNLIENKSVNEA